MLNSLETVTNKEKFLQYFQDRSGLSEEEIWEIFLQFYHTNYNKLKKITEPMKGAKKFLNAAVAADFQLVLATQPVFPEIAVRKRLSWAGLEKIPFKFITHIENMKASKPHRQYYEQILNMLDSSGEECLMIGNDIEMDMAAKQCNIYTYYLDAENSNPELYIENADNQGDFNKLAGILNI
jgi:FMN phosphatase YigB (HAD superfamily)